MENKQFNIKYFSISRYSEDYIISERNKEETSILKGLDLLGFNENSVIIDVGCGVGNFSHYIKEKYGSEIIGIDNNPELLKSARNLYHNNTFLLRNFKDFIQESDSFNYDTLLFIRFFNDFEEVDSDSLSNLIISKYILNKRCIIYIPHFERISFKNNYIDLCRTDEDIKKNVIPLLEKFFIVKDYNNGFYEILKK